MPLPKVRQADDSVISSDQDIFRGVIDDQITHLFFGEADSFIGSSNTGVGRGFPADAFGTLVTPIKQQTRTENPADPPVLIFTTNGPLQEVQTGTVDVRVFDLPPRLDAKKAVENSQVVDKMNASFPESQSALIVSPIIPVSDEVTTEKPVGDVIVIGKIDEPLPEIRIGEHFQVSPIQVSPVQVSQVTQEANTGESFVTNSGISKAGKERQPTTSDHITHVQETEISIGTAAQSMMTQSPSHPEEPDRFLMEHKGDFAVELNPITKDGVNMRSQTATSFNLPAGARHFPMLKVKQVFTISVPPSADPSLLPIFQWREDDSSVEFVLDDKAPIRLEAVQQQQSRMPMTSGIARVQVASLGKTDPFELEDIAGPEYVKEEANVDVDGIFVGDETPTVMVVDQVSPSEQHSALVVSTAEEGTQNGRDVDAIVSIPAETVFGTDSILFRSQGNEEILVNTAVDQVNPFQPETNLGGAADIAIGENRQQTQFQQESLGREALRNAIAPASIVSQLEERIKMAGTTGFQVIGSNQSADKHNQISEERAMRSAFASIASGTEQLSNSHTQRPINVNRHVIDEDVDEPSVSMEIIGLAPIQRDRTNQIAIQRNRTVLIELDDGFVSTEVIGHIDGNQTIHLPRLNQEQETALRKAPRRGGHRQGGKLRTVTTEQIQTAANGKHSDEVRDDISMETTMKQKNRTQQLSRDSNEQDDQSLEVNFRFLSKIKRIMRPELQKQEQRPSMVFFQHSEEENDASRELNNILTNPIFQQKMQEIDGRLKSAPEARGKRLMEKYAEALAISSSSSSPIINSLLPFFIAWILICW